jgi:hypothetical protein
MTFAEIEKVLGFELPESQKYPAWWSNNPTNNVMTNEWLAAGYKSEQVDIEGKKLVFRRSKPLKPTPQSAQPEDGGPKRPRRHPLFGWMKGTITIMPGTDLTAPADPEWAEIAWGKQDRDESSHD